MLLAAKTGNLEMMKSLHERGVEWDSYTTALLSMGHLECLKYAHETGALWDPSTTVWAAQKVSQTIS